MWLTRRLALPDRTPPAVTLAVFFYLGHLFCSGWVASSEGFVALTLAAFGWALYRGEIRLTWHILYIPLLAYGIDSTVSALAAPREIHSFGENALWLKMALFPVVLSLYRQVPRSRILALRALLIYGVFAASFGLFQYFVLGDRGLDHRIDGPTAHVMTLSGMLVASSLLFLVLWLHDRSNRWLLGGTAVVSLALLLTFTRSAWLGWIVGAAALLVLRRPRLLAFAAALFLMFVTLAPMNLFSRMVSSFDTHQASNLDRIRMAQAGVEMIKDSPLLGVGPANVKDVYPLYRKADAPRFRIPHLHNNIIQLWAERGVVAVAAYLMLLALFLRECVHGWNGRESRFAEAGVAVTLALATAGMFEFNFGDTEVFWTLLDVMALVIAWMESAAVEAGRTVPAEPAAPLSNAGAPAVVPVNCP